MTIPPRVKPCPACGFVVPVQASSCPACGDRWPRRKGGRPAPDAEARLAAALAARAWQPGQPVPPIVGKRNALRPEVVLQIRILAKKGKTVSEIAAELNRTTSGIRRYAHDYGIDIRKGESGPSLNGTTAQQIAERTERTRELLATTQRVEDIAEALGVSTATARNYMKRCRDLFGIELPEFDRRKGGGFAARRRKPLKTNE